MIMKKKTSIISILSISLVAVAIATVGFSSWVIGLIQPEVDLSITNISVDSTKDETKYVNIEINSDDVLKIGEVTSASEDSNGEIFVEEGNSDLEIQITKFEIAFNKNNTFENINFSLSLSDNGSLYYTALNDDAFGRTSGKSYSYLEINWGDSLDSTSLNEFTYTEIGNYKFYDNPTSVSKYRTLKFNRGSLFDFGSPSSFYQSKFDNASSTKDKLKMLSQMENELNQMKLDLGGKTITLKATLTIS